MNGLRDVPPAIKDHHVYGYQKKSHIPEIT